MTNLSIATSDPKAAAGDTGRDWTRLELGSGFRDRLPSVEARLAAPETAEFRFVTGDSARNNLDGLHGAFLAGMAELTLALPLILAGQATAWSCVTVECSLQYVAPGDPREPVHGVVELLRTTKRLAFLRGVFRQPHGLISAYSGTVRHGVRAMQTAIG